MNGAKPHWDWTTVFNENNRKEFKTSIESLISLSFSFWNFSTEAECKNFVKYTETDIVMFLLYCVKINNTIGPTELVFLPWMKDYTSEWTEEKNSKRTRID